MFAVVVRLIADDSGQDLLEYALLAAFVGVVGALIFPEIAEQMGVAYESWVSETNAAWEPLGPGS